MYTFTMLWLYAGGNIMNEEPALVLDQFCTFIMLKYLGLGNCRSLSPHTVK